MSGSYEEKLKTGGKLIVKNDNWYIQYYFPGPDLRYNGKFLNVKNLKKKFQRMETMI